MEMQNPDYNDQIYKVSPIYEKVFKATGDGFTGFTVFYGDDRFTNHIRFFEKETHAEISEQVLQLHAGYCQALKGNPRQDKALEGGQ